MRIDFVFSARSALLTFSRSHRFGSAHFEVRAPVRVNRLVTIFGEQPARHCATMLRCCTRPRALAAPRITMGTDSTYRYYYFTIMSDSDCRSIVVVAVVLHYLAFYDLSIIIIYRRWSMQMLTIVSIIFIHPHAQAIPRNLRAGGSVFRCFVCELF